MTRAVRIVRPEAVDGVRQPSQGAHPSVLSLRLDRTLNQGLSALGKRHGVTRHEALRMALAETLRREGLLT